MDEDDRKVTIRLSISEAMVLYEALRRTARDESLELEDRSEERVVRELRDALESQLVAPHKDDYAVLLEAAREDVRGGV